MDDMRSKDEWGHHLGKMLPYRGSSPLTARRDRFVGRTNEDTGRRGAAAQRAHASQGNPTVFSAGSPSFATRPYLACGRSE